MNLGARYWRFSRKVSYIAAAFRRAAEVAVPFECIDAHVLSREAAAILMQDQWNAFCRDVVVNSWRGGVVTLGGTYIPLRSGARTNADAMRALRATYTGRLKKPAYWEPKWFDPGAAIESARRLAIPNFSNVAAGIGATPSPLDELRAVRNYFAHRGRDTSDRLAPFLPGVVSDGAAHALISTSTLGGALVLELWAAQLDSMARVTVA